MELGRLLLQGFFDRLVLSCKGRDLCPVLFPYRIQLALEVGHAAALSLQHALQICDGRSISFARVLPDAAHFVQRLLQLNVEIPLLGQVANRKTKQKEKVKGNPAMTTNSVTFSSFFFSYLLYLAIRYPFVFIIF